MVSAAIGEDMVLDWRSKFLDFLRGDTSQERCMFKPMYVRLVTIRCFQFPWTSSNETTGDFSLNVVLGAYYTGARIPASLPVSSDQLYSCMCSYASSSIASLSRTYHITHSMTSATKQKISKKKSKLLCCQNERLWYWVVKKIDRMQ